METVLRVQIEADQEAGIEPFSTLRQAPRRFWQMFQSAEPWHPDKHVVEPPVDIPAWTELALVA